MANQKVCPRCGTGIDWSIPAQLCPRCLLQEGLDAGLRPRVIGDYELIEEVARGGMGVVYKALQKSLGRIVAVKLILSGRYASEETIRRFRTEAETAGKLQHPNIVAIHDVGEHEGQPYFSMDYVEGENLEALARHRPMEPRCAASYVRSIASAIHYAHRQGVLHRDLKPTNILVDTFDQPRITDFGLARTLETESAQTVSGQVLGSPNFMPPEQAAGEHRLVSVRSDVYSLGAILYYLLTGRLLFPAGNIPAVLDQVKHAEPVSPRLLSPEVSRDLETICLKCLEKAPGRRYESALALAQDLGRFLDDKPILARPVSAAGRAWRWCRRNPALAGALTAVVTLLVAGIAVTSLLAAEARKQAAEAERQAQRAQESMEFLVKKVLTLLDPGEVRGAPLRPVEFCDYVTERLGGWFSNQPVTEVSIRLVLGQTYTQLGKPFAARRELEHALGLQRAKRGMNAALLVQTLTGLVWTYIDGAPIGPAEGLSQEAIDTGQRLLGPDHEYTLFASNTLGWLYVNLGRYPEAESLFTSLVAAYARRPDLLREAQYVQGGLALAVAPQGQLDRAERLLRQRLETALGAPSMGADDPGSTLNTYWMLAQVLGLQPEQAKHREAEALLRNALQRQITILGPEQKWCLKSQQELGVILRRRGDLLGAERYLTNCVTVRIRDYGESAVWTIESIIELGWLRADQGRLNEARSHFQRALALAKVEVSEDHPIALNATHGLGVVALKEQQFQDAEPLLLAAFRGKLKVHGADYPGTVDVRRDLAALYEAWGRAEEAERWRIKEDPPQ